MQRETNYFTLSSNNLPLTPHYNLDIAQKNAFNSNEEWIEYQNSLFKTPVKWETSDSSIVGFEVTNAGCIVKPQKLGNAIITATDSNGVTNEFPIVIIPEVAIANEYFMTNFEEDLFMEYWHSVGQDWGKYTSNKYVSSSRNINPADADLAISPTELTFKNGCYEINPEMSGSTLNFFNNFDRLSVQANIDFYRIDSETRTKIEAPPTFRKWYMTSDNNERQIAIFIKRAGKNSTYLCWRVIDNNEAKEGNIQ